MLSLLNQPEVVIVSHKAIREYCVLNPALSGPLEKWYRQTANADWSNFAEMKQFFNSVDSVGDSLFVFNVAGNKCRVIARIFFRRRTVFIRLIGTHKEYDRIDISTL
jgi:mRNA interferase HigB